MAESSRAKLARAATSSRAGDVTGLRMRDARSPVPIVVAEGDGIGPEITRATVKMLEAAGARIAPEFIDLGEQVYLRVPARGLCVARVSMR